jgi:hypothetical protein
LSNGKLFCLIPADKPIVLINFFKLKEKADYASSKNIPKTGMSGEGHLINMRKSVFLAWNVLGGNSFMLEATLVCLLVRMF